MTRLAPLLLAALLGGCAATSGRTPAQTLAALLSGTFDNARQFEAAPAAVKVAPRVDGLWLDRQIARFWRVDAPALGAEVIYLEWRSGSREGPISRQRLWVFRPAADGSVAMAFHAFKNPGSWAGKADSPEGFRLITKDDLVSYPESCDARFVRADKHRWQGRIRPEDCLITAQSGRTMALDVSIDILPGQLIYQEAGLLGDGKRAFHVPSAAPYRFEKQQS